MNSQTDSSGGTVTERWRPKANPWLIAVLVAMAAFTEVLDTSIANVALPHMAGNLSPSNGESTWILTSYLASNAIVLPITGWFAGLLGRKRFFMVCLAVFTLLAHTTLGQLTFTQVVHALAARLTTAGLDATTATHQAYARLYRAVIPQASTLSYIDTFAILAVGAGIMFLLSLTLDRNQPGAGAVAIG